MNLGYRGSLKGYWIGIQIMEIYEIWHYGQISQYDAQSQTGGLFSDYISTFQGYKQEASDCPEWVVDDKTQDEYMKNIKKEKVSVSEKIK